MTPSESARHGFVGRVIAGSARNPVLTLLFVGALTVWGILSLRSSRLDAIPDLSDTQAIIFTEWMGRSPDLVEDQITYPISSSLLAAPRVEYVRGQSMFGMSFVYVIFEDGTDIYWARSRVLEYLNSVRGRLPEGVAPTLGPDATGVGWVFEYALLDETGRHSLAELRSLQDWNIRYALSNLQEAIVEGAARRIRPKLMTVTTLIVGLVPVLWSTGTGADVMKRIAAPMVGGLVTSFLMELAVYPAIFALWKGRMLKKEAPALTVVEAGQPSEATVPG